METWSKNNKLYRAGVTRFKNIVWLGNMKTAKAYRNSARIGNRLARTIYEYTPPRNLKLINLTNPNVVSAMKNSVMEGYSKNRLNYVIYINKGKVVRRSGYEDDKYLASAIKQLKNNYNGYIWKNNHPMFEVLLIGNAAKSVHFSNSKNFNRFRKESIQNMFTLKSDALSRFLKTQRAPNVPKTNKKPKAPSAPKVPKVPRPALKTHLLALGNEDY